MYVDWYDGDRILRPMEEAASLGVPIFLNLEHGRLDNDVLSRYASRATICQAVVDEAQRGDGAEAVITSLLEAGVQTALVTMAEKGSLVADRQGQVRLTPPDVRVVDGCAVGAMFSAGFIYGYLNSRPLEESARIATGAASLNCTVVGPKAFSMEEVERVMARPADR